MLLDLRVFEILSSKLCHDLVSPVSAINNGVELIEDIGGDVVSEAMDLIGNSARQAARRLRLYRLAYGRAGGEAQMSARDVRQIMLQYFEGGKITLAWDEGLALEPFADKKGSFKVTVNALMLAEEALPYGGTLSLTVVAGEAAAVRITVTGRSAVLNPAMLDALQGNVPVDDLTPRTIQSYWTGRVGKHYGVPIEYQVKEEDPAAFTLVLTPV